MPETQATMLGSDPAEIDIEDASRVSQPRAIHDFS